MENGNKNLGFNKLQAIFRGSRTRQLLAETRREFLEIFEEIQAMRKCTEDTITPVWWPRDQICLPRFDGSPKKRPVVAISPDSSNSSKNSKKTSQFSDSSRREVAVEEEPVKDTDTQLTNSLPSARSDSFNVNVSDIEEAQPSSVCEAMSIGEAPMDNALRTSTPEKSENVVSSDKENIMVTHFSVTVLKSDIESAQQEQDAVHRTKEQDTEDKRSEVVSKNYIAEVSPASDSVLRKCDDFLSRLSNGDKDKHQIREITEEIELELLWIRQAIDSRKQYLKLKQSRGSLD